jgi:divalent metal cation (Fe/Co/Zn/Cd) transporter
MPYFAATCSRLQALLCVNITSLASFVTMLSSGTSLPLLEPLKKVTNVANITASAWEQLRSSITSVVDEVFPTTATGSIGINLNSVGNAASIVAGEFDAFFNNLKVAVAPSATASATLAADASTAYLSAGEVLRSVISRQLQ